MRKILFYFLIILLSAPFVSVAQDKYTLLEPLPCIPGTGNICTASSTITEISLDTYIGYIFKFAIAISAFLAVIMIIVGGFEIMLSEAIPAKMEGKQRVYNALIGLLMVLSSYLILRTIDPRLVEINTSIKAIEPKPMPFDMADFQKALNADLTNSSVLQGQELGRLITEQEKSLNELKTISDRLQDQGLSPEEKLELQKRQVVVLENVKGNITQKDVAKEQMAALGKFKTAVGILYEDPDHAGENINPYIARVEYNTIGEQYRPAIASAVAGGRPEAVSILEKQRDFFISETREELDVKNAITRGASKQALQEKINTYKNELEKPTKISGTGVDVSTYNSILNARIIRLTQAVESKK
jgi:hypothetical protein